MNPNPKISVVVPVYNVEKFLPQCIESILSQTFTDFELLLVNDGSPDGSGKICDEYARKDQRVRVFHKENGGVSSARLFGISLANGKYIYFLDSDDFLTNDALINLSSELLHDQYDIVQGGHVIEGEDRRSVVSFAESSCDYSCIDYLRVLLTHRLFYTCGMLIRKDFFRELSILKSYKMAEDAVVLVQLVSQAKKIRIIPVPVFCYVQRIDSVTQCPRKMHVEDFFDATSFVGRFLLAKYAELEFPVKRFLIEHILICYSYFPLLGFYRNQEIKERVGQYWIHDHSLRQYYFKKNYPFYFGLLFSYYWGVSCGYYLFKLLFYSRVFSKKISRLFSVS